MKVHALFVIPLLLFLHCAKVFALSPGDQVPEFKLENAEGSAITPQSFKGKYLYIDFWASWCAPCQLSFPWMEKIRAKHSPAKLEIVAINLDVTKADADAFLSKAPHSFTILYDPSGSAPGMFHPPTMPTSYLVDPEGKIVSIHPGFKASSAEQMELELDKVLAGAK